MIETETWCAQCLHSSDWHSLDDSLNISPTDPRAPFRCRGCSCPAFEQLPPEQWACRRRTFAETLAINDAIHERFARDELGAF